MSAEEKIIRDGSGMVNLNRYHAALCLGNEAVATATKKALARAIEDKGAYISEYEAGEIARATLEEYKAAAQGGVRRQLERVI
jgi:hypothetical protein